MDLTLIDLLESSKANGLCPMGCPSLYKPFADEIQTHTDYSVVCLMGSGKYYRLTTPICQI